MAQVGPSEQRGEAIKVVGLALQPAGRLFSYLAGPFELKRKDRVVIEIEPGSPHLATVEIPPHEPGPATDLEALRRILRLADDNDLRAEEEAELREAKARQLCLERLAERGLRMKLVKVDYRLDGRKAIFYFTAEERVDFRDLVRELASLLRVRVEMKQIGARDQTKITAAIGPCGRELCCAAWLREFEAITIKMAREQGLALNPGRLAGMCGRLKCCLRYEYATYLELKRGLPSVGKKVMSTKGDGKVIKQNILKHTVTIQLDQNGGVVEAGLEDLVSERPS